VAYSHGEQAYPSMECRGRVPWCNNNEQKTLVMKAGTKHPLRHHFKAIVKLNAKQNMLQNTK